MDLREIANVQTGLSVTPAASAGFGVPACFVDHEDIPADVRILPVTRSSYGTDLAAGNPAKSWCTTLWSQNRNPATAYLVRWISEAIPPAFVMAGAKTVMETWAAVTAGRFAVTDGTSTEQLTTGTMAAVTDMDDVCAVIQTGLRASVTFAAWAATATVSVDARGRVVAKSGLAGADKDSFQIVTPTAGAGTDITGSDYLNIASRAYSVAGMDAETMDATLTAMLEKTKVPILICERGGSASDQVDLATAVIAQRRVCFLVLRDEDVKDPLVTNDAASQLKALANNNTIGIYTEHDEQNPDAAAIGEVAPRPEGSTSYALTGFASVSESGLGPDGVTTVPLTPAERIALDAKGCDYLVNPAGVVHLRRGLCFGGAEMRLRIAYLWADQRGSEGIYAFLLANPVTVFADDHISAIGGIVASYWETLVTRRAVEPGFAISLPSAASINATIKATHTLTLEDIASLISQLAVNDVSVTASATV